MALDLFSGTGGGTAAFVGRGWQVVRVDLDRRHHPTVLADVGRLPIGGPVNFLWASPPCTEFSMADARVDHRTKRPSLDLVVAALAAVRDLRPRFWVLENVRGAIPFLGIPVQKIGPWCLWGYFPPVAVTLAMQTYLKRAAGPTAIDRAAIPYELSVAVADAVERWWAVPSLLDLRPFRKHRHQAAAAVRPDGRDAAPEGLFTTGAYVCTVCRRVPVDAENGYDTCPSCLALV
ncbi:MAG: DNA cytosine methyltransferase [Candidatus Methylomirabilales bacterium]